MSAVSVYAPGEGDRSVYVTCGQGHAEITAAQARQLAADFKAAAERAENAHNPWQREADRG